MEKKLSNYVIVLLLVAAFQHANAQFTQDVDGRPLTAKTGYTDIQGTPFLTEGWVTGAVKLADGRTYKDMSLRYNEMDDKLFFRDKKGDTLEFVDPVKEFKLENPMGANLIARTFKSGFKNIPNTTESSFFEVLADGTASLIKRYTKSITELKEYNSPTIKRFEESTKYYLIVAEKAVPLKRDQKFILTTLGNKQPEMEAYIKDNKLNLKHDDDLAKLITYYNSI